MMAEGQDGAERDFGKHQVASTTGVYADAIVLNHSNAR